MKILLLSLTLLLSVNSFSQILPDYEPQSKKDSTRFTYGGYAGLSGTFGTYGGFGIYVSPRVGYKIKENLEAGLSGTYNLQSNRYYSVNMVGVGPFVNYYFGRSAYLTTQYHHNFVSQKDKVNHETITANEPALYIGGGFMQHMGGKTYLQSGLLYNVLYKKENSVFSGGLVPNVGIVVGL